MSCQQLGLNWDLVDVVGGVSRFLVNPLHGFGVRGLGKAEDHPALGVGPCVLEVNSLFGLDGQVSVVGFLECVWGDPLHRCVYVHELGHFEQPFWWLITLLLRHKRRNSSLELPGGLLT